MSSIDVDHIAIVERIIEILKTDSIIYDPQNPENKLRKIFYAETDYNMDDDSTPYAYIQFADTLESTREGIGTDSINPFQQLMYLRIITVVQEHDSEQVHKVLSYFTNLVRKKINENPRLYDPATGNTDPKATRLLLQNITRVYQKKGMEKQGMAFSFQIQIGVEWELEIPDIPLTLPLISKPSDLENVTTDIDLTDDAVIAVTKITDPGSLDVEFESNPTIDSQLMTLINGGDEHMVNLKRGGSTIQTSTVVFIAKRQNSSFDNVEKTILELMII